METTAVILQRPETLTVERLTLTPPQEGDLVIRIEWSGISTGTERLLWTGRMPPFPGLGYPLVPGYESVGTVLEAHGTAEHSALVGRRVFVPGAQCFGEVRGLFGGAASRLVVPAARVVLLPDGLQEQGVLLALAATAQRAVTIAGGAPDLVVGNGVLGRLVARLARAQGAHPTVWEIAESRREGEGEEVVHPEADARKDYQSAVDVSGDPEIIDVLSPRLARGGQVVLAGFYAEPVSFQFPMMFMKEASVRISSEWKPDDLTAALQFIQTDPSILDGLITHRRTVEAAAEAYATAFEDPSCLKMLLDWRAIEGTST